MSHKDHETIKLISPINKQIYQQLDELKQQHDESTPYKHVVINNLLTPDRYTELVNESINTIKTNFKETDLFKVYQSSDLLSINNIETNYQLLSFRKTIYSKKFRKFIRQILNCDELIDRIDCSMNAYSNGCHLLCHDDVIGTRCVSYIIYLADLDQPWLPSEGGALELYPLDESTIIDHGANGGKQGLPQCIPTKSILPSGNTMAFFKVQPGRSYHSVQEVFSSDRPRLSISGWYHTVDIPIGSDFASLNQIMLKTDKKQVYLPIYPVISTNNLLTDEEIDYLSMYVNPIYLTNESINQLNKKFCKFSSINLIDFLSNHLITNLSNKLITKDQLDKLGNSNVNTNYYIGIDSDTYGHWQLVGPPHISRYLTYKHTKTNNELNNNNITYGEFLYIIKQLFHKPKFIKYLQLLTSCHLIGYKNEIRRFRPGFDYTVAYYKNMVISSKLDTTLCFVDTISDGNNIDLWDSGDVGGFECYIESSTDENNQSIEAAEVYQSDKNDDNELLSISPNNNMLTIVLRDENVMKFVKYVSYNAPGSRWDITTEYDIDLEHLKDNSTSEDSDNDDDSDNEDDDPMDEDEL